MRDLLPFELREHDIAPICSLRQSRKRNPTELVPVGGQNAGLESEMFGSTEKIGIRKDLAGLCKLMAQLRPISR